MIRGFHGQFAFLSNVFPCQVLFEGETYPSVEHAFQAAKTEDPEIRSIICAAPDARHAKKLGQEVVLRHDWETIKVSIMTVLVRQKFKCPQLRAALLSTGSRYLEETNWWGDKYWGVCNGEGENQLGRILMSIREDFQIADSDRNC